MVGVMELQRSERSGSVSVKTREVTNDIVELNSPMEVFSRIRAVAERVMDPIRRPRVPNPVAVCVVPVYMKPVNLPSFRIFMDIGTDPSSMLCNHSAPLPVPCS